MLRPVLKSHGQLQSSVTQSWQRKGAAHARPMRCAAPAGRHSGCGRRCSPNCTPRQPPSGSSAPRRQRPRSNARGGGTAAQRRAPAERRTHQSASSRRNLEARRHQPSNCASHHPCRRVLIDDVARRSRAPPPFLCCCNRARCAAWRRRGSVAWRRWSAASPDSVGRPARPTRAHCRMKVHYACHLSTVMTR